MRDFELSCCSRIRNFLPRNISRLWTAVDVTIQLHVASNENERKEKEKIGKTIRYAWIVYFSNRAQCCNFALRSRAMPPSQFPRTYDHFYLMHCCQFAARYCHDLDKLAHVSKTVTQKRLEDLYERRMSDIGCAVLTAGRNQIAEQIRATLISARLIIQKVIRLNWKKSYDLLAVRHFFAYVFCTWKIPEIFPKRLGTHEMLFPLNREILFIPARVHTTDIIIEGEAIKVSTLPRVDTRTRPAYH